MSILKMVQSRSPWACSLAIIASLTAYMQHTDEQYPFPHRLVSAGAHALEPGDAPGFLAVQGPHQMAEIRPRGGKDPLELLAGDHVGRTAVGEKVQVRRFVSLAAHGENHRTDGEGGLPLLIAVVDGLGHTHVLAQPASDAGIRVDGKGQGNGLGILDIGGRRSSSFML